MGPESEKTFLKIKLLGGQENYQAFLKMEELPLKNTRTPTYYSLPAEEQLQLNVDLLKEMIALLSKMDTSDEIYKFLPLRGFGAGYPLLNHKIYFGHFLKYARKSFQDASAVAKFEVIGSVLYKRVRVDLQTVNNSVPVKALAKDNGIQIVQDQQEWFYSRLTNIHMSAAVLLVNLDGKTFPVYVRLRDAGGNLLPNVRTKHFGETISPQHFLIGFNLGGYMVPETNLLDNGWNDKSFEAARGEYQKIELLLSLLDLYKSCDITIRYTSMRKQFRTIPNSKQQRSIIQYQGVSSRVADGLALAFTLASLLTGKPGFTEYYQYGHKLIFSQLVTLRECCGGFGYLRASGHPMLIERVALRASQVHKEVSLPIPKVVMKEYSPYMLMNEDNIKFDYKESGPKTELSHYMVASQYKFLEATTPLQWQTYIYDFVKCCAIQQFSRGETWNSFRKSLTTVLDLSKFISVSECINSSKYLNWTVMKGNTREQVLEKLLGMKRTLLHGITANFERFRQSLPVAVTHDAILGRNNQEEFYQEVLSVSKNNHRNSAEFANYVRQPILQYLANGNQGNL